MTKPIGKDSPPTRSGLNTRGSLLRRTGLNAAAYGYAQITTIAIQFIQIPLFLHFWGVEKYGEWIVLAGIPLSLAVLDFGITQASASKSAMEAGARNWLASRDTLATARVYALGVGVSVIALVALSTLIIDWSQVLKLSHCDRFSASAVLVVLTASLAVSFQGGCLDAWMRAYGEAALSGFLAASTRLCELLVAAMLLLLGYGFVGVAIGYLVAAVTVRVLHAFVALTRAPEELRSFGAFQMSGLRQVVKPGSGFIALSLTQVVTIQGGVQVLNQVATPAVVVAFNMTRTLVRLVVNLGMLVNNALRPEFSIMVGRGEREQASHFARKVFRFVAVVGVLGYLAIVASGPAFLLFWSGGRVDQSHLVVALIGIHALLGLFWHVPAALQMAENRHAEYAFVYAASAVMALILWIVFARVVPPIAGAALLLALPELAMLLLFGGKSIACRFCKAASEPVSRRSAV